MLQTTRKLLSSPSLPSDDDDDGDGDGDDFEVVRTGLCHRPITPRGVPLLKQLSHSDTGLGSSGDGEVEEGGKVWVCAGHGPWGISLSLGTGRVLAEKVLGRAESADVSRLAW